MNQDDDLFRDEVVFTLRLSRAELLDMRRNYRAEVEERIESSVKAHLHVNGRARKSNWMWHRKKKRCCR